MRMYFRVRHYDRYVGLFVLVTLILIAAALVFIARGQKWFAPRNNYTALFNKVSGLTPGTPVTIAGVEVGIVESLGLNDQGKVEMELQVYKKFQTFVRTDSVVTIASTLLGAKTVEITQGSPAQPPAPPGSQLGSQEPRELADMLKEIDLKEPLRKVNDALDNVKTATARLSSPEGELFSTLRNVEFLTAQLKNGEGSIGALLQDKKLHQDVTATVASVRRSAAELEETARTATKASREIPGMIAEVNRAVQQVPVILSDVQKATARITENAEKAAADVPEITGKVKAIADDVQVVTGSLRQTAPEIGPLVTATRESLEEADRMMEGLKKHWLLRGLFPQPQTKPLEAAPRESPYPKETSGGSTG